MPTSGQPIYGQLVFTRHTDFERRIFGMIIDRADPLVLINPDLLKQIESNGKAELVSITDEVLTLRGMGGVVTYRLTGWKDGNRIGERIDS